MQKIFAIDLLTMECAAACTEQASMDNANKQSQTTQPLLKWYSINLDTFPRPFFFFWLHNLGHPKQQLFLISISVTSAVVPHQHRFSTDWKATFHLKEFN